MISTGAHTRSRVPSLMGFTKRFEKCLLTESRRGKW
jgi:hypothetical protein